jgi:hypothetical protein
MSCHQSCKQLVLWKLASVPVCCCSRELASTGVKTTMGLGCVQFGTQALSAGATLAQCTWRPVQHHFFVHSLALSVAPLQLSSCNNGARPSTQHGQGWWAQEATGPWSRTVLCMAVMPNTRRRAAVHVHRMVCASLLDCLNVGGQCLLLRWHQC